MSWQMIWQGVKYTKFKKKEGLIDMRKHERVSEVPVTMQEELKLPTTTIETPRVSPINARWEPIPLQWLDSNPAFPLATRKETSLPWGNMTGFLRSLPQLERHPKLPNATWEKPQDSPLNRRGSPFPLHHFKSNPKYSFKTSGMHTHFLCFFKP